MLEPVRLVLAFALAAALAAFLCRGVMMLGIMDAPTETRKTQSQPVPSAGGLGVAAAAFAALAFTAAISGLAIEQSAWVIAAGGVAFLILGLADDTMRLRASWRLLAMLAVVIAMTAAGVRTDAIQPWPGAALQLPLAIAVAGSALWLIVLVNAVNFMDGANGLAMGMAAIASAGLGLAGALIGAGSIALLAFALSGALAGFLVWNISGRLFAGDAGALFAGAVLGGLSLEFVRLRPDLLFVPPIILMPFLSDVLLTLFWRVRHGKKLFEGHRDHAYQIALKAGLKHWQVSGIHAISALNAAAIGVVATAGGAQIAAMAFLVLLVVTSWIHLRVRRSGVRAGLVGADIP